ncbi:hypothetical protein FXO37_02592 [Capsicum annuum]|nr:hypothetical protein FXO37_02592 [Capsicum annuum]
MKSTKEYKAWSKAQASELISVWSLLKSCQVEGGEGNEYTQEAPHLKGKKNFSPYISTPKRHPKLGLLCIGGSPYIHTKKSFSWLSLNPNGQIHLSLISDQYSGVKTLVRRLLCSARPVVIQTPVNPTASDQDLQQAQLWQLSQRTTTLPFGRGAFTLATTCTLLTEALTVPKLILAGWLPSQQNAMVNLDPNVRNVQELKSWPEFHNVVAVGLRLAPPQVLSRPEPGPWP